jgi:pyrroloquinoline quinone (PQQ) biosynthesis protein C
MEPHTIQTLQRFRRALGLPPREVRAAKTDPLAPEKVAI